MRKCRLYIRNKTRQKKGAGLRLIPLFILFALFFAVNVNVWALPGIPGVAETQNTCRSCQSRASRMSEEIKREVTDQVKGVKPGSVIMFDGHKWVVREIENGRLYVCPYHDENFYEQGETGWFYGETCRWIEQQGLIEKITSERLAARRKEAYRDIPWEKLTNEKFLSGLTAPEFRELFSKVKEVTVMEPTEKHMAAYVYMTDFMRRKALKFMYAEQEFLSKNPEFDMRKESGSSGWARRFIVAQKEHEMDAVFRQVKDRAGLYFFVSGKCPYCKAQSKILNWFTADYGWTVVSASMDYCPDTYPNCVVKPALFNVFNVQYIPSIFLLYRGDDNKPHIYPVANGLTTYDILKERVFYYLKKILRLPDTEMLPPKERVLKISELR